MADELGGDFTNLLALIAKFESIEQKNRQLLEQITKIKDEAKKEHAAQNALTEVLKAEMAQLRKMNEELMKGSAAIGTLKSYRAEVKGEKINAPVDDVKKELKAYNVEIDRLRLELADKDNQIVDLRAQLTAASAPAVHTPPTTRTRIAFVFGCKNVFPSFFTGLTNHENLLQKFLNVLGCTFEH